MEFLSQNLQTIIIAAVILLVVLIALGVWRAFSPRVTGGRRGQRIGISEYYELDKTRRLVLVRRDNVEHLVLIGGAQDVVIEPGISFAGAPSSYSSSAADGPIIPVAGAARPAPRAPVFTERKPSGRAASEGPVTTLRPREEPEL